MMNYGVCYGYISWVSDVEVLEFYAGALQGHPFLSYIRNYYGANNMIMLVDDCQNVLIPTDAQSGPVTVSFDGGTTWYPTVNVMGGVTLYIAGSLCTLPDPSAVILPIGAYPVWTRMTSGTQIVTRRAAGDISIVSNL